MNREMMDPSQQNQLMVCYGSKDIGLDYTQHALNPTALSSKLRLKSGTREPL